MTAVFRTFRAPDPAAALAAVKAALGPDAVLISTRTVEGGLFRRPEIEVTAALPDPAAPPDAPREARPAAAAVARYAAARVDPAGAESPAAAPTPRRVPEEDGVALEVAHLRRSLEDARRALDLVARETRTARELELPPGAASLHARLTARGVEPVLAEELVRHALQVASARGSALEAAARDLLGARLVACRAPWLGEGPEVVALVGPTGVGKTTTIAKIAARALLEARRRVALVTVDTYRVGACEQLARYGEIMNVPVLVARDRVELLAAVARVKDRDLVLVDTAGRSCAEDVARQVGVLRAVPGIQLQLVLSAATGPLDLAAHAERWRALHPDRVIVSKVDEAAGPGAILSAAVRLGRPISCLADGQRVPEDLHAATAAGLANLVLPPAPAAGGQE
jgi:flagellar biosynthesis protein FlhF